MQEYIRVPSFPPAEAPLSAEEVDRQMGEVIRLLREKDIRVQWGVVADFAASLVSPWSDIGESRWGRHNLRGECVAEAWWDQEVLDAGESGAARGLLPGDAAPREYPTVAVAQMRLDGELRKRGMKPV